MDFDVIFSSIVGACLLHLFEGLCYKLFTYILWQQNCRLFGGPVAVQLPRRPNRACPSFFRSDPIEYRLWREIKIETEGR